MICLGIDVGSTSIKGGVLDLQQQAVREVQQVPFPAPVSGLADPTWFEVEPTQIVDALRTLVNELLDCQPNAQAIFFSGQMGGTILVDRDSGEPLTRYLSWRDQRAEYSLGEMHARLGKSLSLVELGYELKAGSTSALLFWLVRERQLSPRANDLKCIPPKQLGYSIWKQATGIERL
jgi:sugar (pentulose or hexulose) kinase